MQDNSWAEIVRSKGVIHDEIGPSYSPSPLGANGVIFTEDDVSEVLAKWKSVLVGHVMGSRPTFQALKRFTDSKWGNWVNLM